MDFAFMQDIVEKMLTIIFCAKQQ